MRDELVIVEYAVGNGSLNPTNYDVFKYYPKWNRPLTDVEYYYSDEVPMAVRSYRHMCGIVGVIKKHKVGNFKIVSVPYSNLEKHLEVNHHKVIALTASVGGFMNDEFLKKYKNEIYTAMSVGNEGDLAGNAHLEGFGSQKDYWSGIGSVNEKLDLQKHSSWGAGAVDYMGIDGELITYDYFGIRTSVLTGTSYACPYHVTQVCNMVLDFQLKYGRDMRIDEILASLKKYKIDLLEPGRDLKTGEGFYKYNKGEYVMEFKDQALISDWAVTAVNKAKVLGILKGDENGNVNPKSSVTLEQLMVILDRMGTLGE